MRQYMCEIKTQLKKNNDLISELLQPEIFVLNKEIMALKHQNQQLRQDCVGCKEKCEFNIGENDE